MKNTLHKKITKSLQGILLILTVVALVRPTISRAIVGYEPTGEEGEMHIMSEGMYEQQPQQQESEEVRAMPEPYESTYGRSSESYAGRGAGRGKGRWYGRGYEKQTGRAGMDEQGRMVRPGPQLNPEEVTALGVNGGREQGQGRITETGEVRAQSR